LEGFDVLFKYMLALAGSFLFFVDPLLASGMIPFLALAMLALVAAATGSGSVVQAGPPP
jgi:hypothetical protein